MHPMSFFRTNPATATRLYNALWYPALPFALMASSGANPQSWRERLGRLNPEAMPLRVDKRRIWAHAASVGEVEALRPVLTRLTRAVNDLEITLTTMTTTGREAARRRLPLLSACRLAPLDFPGSVRSFLDQVRPQLILVAETELWPNFFTEGTRSGARIVLVNGRVSERSMRRYRLVSGIIRTALLCAEKILVQTATDANRFRELGAPPDRVIVTGNTKFDLDDSSVPSRQALVDFIRDRPVLIAGSTAGGEERMVLTAYLSLVRRFSDLALVVAPRHLERVPEVEAELRAQGVPFLKATSLESSPSGRAKILLLDTLGDLRGLYRYATIAFVGGSIAPPRGGQNLAEPASLAVPVLFGSHYENQQMVGDALIEGGGAFVINDSQQLEERCASLLVDPVKRSEFGRRARNVIEWMGEGAAITVRHLLPLLETVEESR